jgi:hypothetical protein
MRIDSQLYNDLFEFIYYGLTFMDTEILIAIHHKEYNYERGYNAFDKNEVEKKISLHGTKDSRIVVDLDKTQIIMEAIADGWNIDIEYAIIYGKLDIRSITNEPEKGLTINGNIDIIHSEIRGNIHFCSTTFRFADFTSTTFNYADFRGAIFSCGASFHLATFNGYVTFIEATFGGYMDVNFVSATFNNYAVFDNTTFPKVVDFNHSRFMKSVNLNKANLDNISPESLDSIGDAYVRSSIRGSHYFFHKAGEGYWNKPDYSKASDSFRNARVEYEKEGKYDEAAVMYNEVGEKYRNIRNYSLAANCFREAKVEYNNEGKHRESSAMYVKEMKCIKEGSRWWKNYLYWFWEITCNYGDSWLRFALWVFGILVFFACIYLPSRNDLGVFGIEFDNYPYSDYVGNDFLTALYLSISTFASFGDLKPVNDAGKFWVSFELLLGYLMFGVLITLVARKMTRS